MVTVRGDQVSYESPFKAMVSPSAAPDFSADQWAARGIRLAGLDIMLIAVYLDDGLGIERQNLARMEQISLFIKALKRRWIIVGERNFEASALQRIDWPLFLGAELLAPAVEFTCTSGRGRIVDFGIESKQLRPLCSIRLDEHSP